MIDYFDLTVNISLNIYSNLEKRISLIISGIGADNAKKAIIKLYKLEFHKDDLWINIGIAGHKSYEIGSIYEVKKVISNKNKFFFFTNSFFNELPTSTVCCVDFEEKEFNKECLYDMESFGYLEALDKLTLRENIFIFKIVSDNLFHKPKNYKNFAITNIKKNIIKISKIINVHRTNRFFEKTDIKFILNIIKQKYHITFYNEKKLEKILIKVFSLKDKDEVEKEIISSKSLKDLIKQLEDYLLRYTLKI